MVVSVASSENWKCLLSCKNTLSWKTQFIQPLDVPLYLCVSSLSWTWLVWEPEMSLFQSCQVLGGSRCVSPFYESPASRQTGSYSSQKPPSTHARTAVLRLQVINVGSWNVLVT